MAANTENTLRMRDSIEDEPKRHIADANFDAALENEVGYREYVEGLSIVVSEKEGRWVRTKIDLIVLPIFLVTQMLQFLDKTALNYANLFDYTDDLGLEDNQFNYLSAMVYAGYFFGQYPCGWLIGRYKAQRVLAIACCLWGVMVLILTQAKSYSSALAVRFIMGLFEAAVTPSLTLMSGWWYKRREIPLRQCIWYSSLGLGGIVGSYISMGISTMPENTTPRRWQILFYVLGGVTVLWAAIIYVFLPDAPSNARFLNERQRIIAVKRVASNELGIKNKSFNKKQAFVAFYDPKMWLIWISVFAAAIPNGVVNSFSTIIIEDLGFGTTKTTELKSVGDAVNVISLWIAGAITLNIPNTRLLTATAANVLCTVAAACMAYLPRSDKWGRLVSFWLVNSQSVGFVIADLTTLASNMGGYTHRWMANALVFTAYCWGNFAGPFVVKESEAPNYPTATAGLLAGYAIKMGCHILLLVYIFLVNRHRDRKYGPADRAKSDEAGMQDQTEFENKDFRYVL